MVVLPEVIRPMTLGFNNDEIRATVHSEDSSGTLWRAQTCQ